MRRTRVGKWFSSSSKSGKSAMFSSLPFLALSFSTKPGKFIRSQSSWSWPGPLSPSAPPPAQQGHRHRVPRAMSRRHLKMPKEENPKPLWATCTSARSPAQYRSVAWGSEGIPCTPICVYHLYFHIFKNGVSEKRTWKPQLWEGIRLLLLYTTLIAQARSKPCP